MATARMEVPRRRRRREDSEQEILEAAERLLHERPFRDLTVDDLMAATSQSRTAFYRHFTDRQDLMIRLLRDLNAELWEMIEGWLRGGGDPLAEGLAPGAQLGPDQMEDVVVVFDDEDPPLHPSLLGSRSGRPPARSAAPG